MKIHFSTCLIFAGLAVSALASASQFARAAQPGEPNIVVNGPSGLLANGSGASFSETNPYSPYALASYGGKVASAPLASPVLAGLQLSTGTVMGGSVVVGMVGLSAPAQSGGYAVTLGSDSQFAAVPSTITVPVGATTASFPIWTDPTSAAQTVTIDASDGTHTFTAALSLSAYVPSVYNVQLTSSYVVGGTSGSAAVQLDHFVTAAAGEVVSLSTSNVSGVGPADATVPASVTVPQGANSASFVVNTSVVASETAVNIFATDGATQNGVIFLMPVGGLGVKLAVTPAGIFGGDSSTGTVTLSAAQVTDTVVALSSNGSSVTVPATVTIPVGQLSATFAVNTTAVSTATSVVNGGWIWIAASVGSSSQAITVSVYPAQLHSIVANPGTVEGGNTSTGTVTLSGNAPSGGIVVSLSSNSSAATVPATVTFPAGSSSATFTISTTPIGANIAATLTAAYNGQTRMCGFDIAGYQYLGSLTVSPNSVLGGGGSTGTVTLTRAAPPTGLTVNLSSNSSAAAGPVSVTVPAGSLSATFSITTSSVSETTLVTFTGTFANQSKTANLTVMPMGLISLTGDQSIIGGQLVLVTATLNTPAPQGGAIVYLSSNSSYASVPPEVVVPTGATTVNFYVETNSTTRTRTVTITGVSTISAHINITLLP